MILGKGKWLGTGKLLVEGASLGEGVEVDLDITEDDNGITIEGGLGGEFEGNVSI